MTVSRIFYVAVGGNDAWSGLADTPAASGGDGPFASLAKARDAVRAIRAAGHAGKVEVRIGGGRYVLDQPLTLGPEDSGTAASPTVYAACHGQTPILDGGRDILNWRPLEDALPGLPASATGRVYFADIAVGWRFSRLYCDDLPLPRSAWTADESWEAWPRAALGQREDELAAPPGSLPAGDPCPCAELNFLPTPYTYWSNAIADVHRIDAAAGLVQFDAFPLHMPKALKSIPFRFENLASGLSAPGRWFLDYRRGRVYLLPPDGWDARTARMSAPLLGQLVSMTGATGPSGLAQPVRHVELRGLTLTRANLSYEGQRLPPGLDARGAAVTLDCVEDIQIADCRVIESSGAGIAARGHVRRVRISSCEVAHAGGTGIVTGGGLADPAPSCAANIVEDNRIHDIGQAYWHSSAISAGMSDRAVIRRNDIHHIPYIGISTGGVRHRTFAGWPRRHEPFIEAWNRLGGGEAPTVLGVKKLVPGHNRIEGNRVMHFMRRLDDGGGIYCHAGHHNIVAGNVVGVAERQCAFGLYFDDEETDSRMENNIVFRVGDSPVAGHSNAVHLNDNAGNSIVNNILIGGEVLMSFNCSYGGHRIERNIFVFSGSCGMRSSPNPVPGGMDGRRQADWNAGPAVMDRNLYWSSVPGSAQAFVDALKGKGFDAHSIVADPTFAVADADKGEFRVSPESPAVKLLGFVPFDTQW